MSKSNKTILLVEDDELFQQAMVDYLVDKYEVWSAKDAQEAEILLGQKTPNLVLLDILLPEMDEIKDGVELLKRIKEARPQLPVIMLTAVGEIPKVVECIKHGAFDYITKEPTSLPQQLILAIEQALESAEIKEELEQRRQLQLADNREFQLVGDSPAANKVRKVIDVLANSDCSVLIQGETGTGKEIIARRIHAQSRRAEGPFVAINCGAIPKDLIEAELFGYKRGAFTGAATSEIGKFRLSHRGTLLLDEIGEFPLSAQSKLLRALEHQEFYPVGSSELKTVDVRVIASTNCNLEEMVGKGLFREDLFYRLNVYSIIIPPLRERPEDIMPLSMHFLEQFNLKFRKNFKKISPAAEVFLMGRPWKGNVRELRNLFERVLLFNDGPVVEREYFEEGRPPDPKSSAVIDIPPEGLDKALEKFEQDIIRVALKISGGNRAKAAKLLQISPPAFYYRLEKYGWSETVST